MTGNKLDERDQRERERVGATLRVIRQLRQMNADALASSLNPPKSRPYLANIEAGRKRLTPELRRQVADVLDVPEIAIAHPALDDLGDGAA